MNIDKVDGNKLRISGTIPAGYTVQLNIYNVTTGNVVAGYPMNFTSAQAALGHTTGTLPNGTYYLSAITQGSIENATVVLP
jgi:hypothetical protein